MAKTELSRCVLCPSISHGSWGLGKQRTRMNGNIFSRVLPRLFRIRRVLE